MTFDLLEEIEQPFKDKLAEIKHSLILAKEQFLHFDFTQIHNKNHYVWISKLNLNR